MNETIYNIISIGAAVGLSVVAVIILRKIRQMRVLVDSDEFCEGAAEPIEHTPSTKTKPVRPPRVPATAFDFRTLTPTEPTDSFVSDQLAHKSNDKNKKQRETAPMS